MPEAAVFTFRVEGTRADRQLVITAPAVEDGKARQAPTGPTVVWEGDIDEEEDIRDVFNEMRAVLEVIHQHAGKALNLDPARSAKTVEQLLLLSKDIGYALFKELPGELYQHAHVRAPDAMNSGRPPRIIEVISPQKFSFPFELVQWQDLTEHDSAPERQIRALLGMSAMVTRRFSDAEGDAGWGRLNNEEALPVTVFRHKGLEASVLEVAYLEEDVGDLVDVYGPWPKDAPLAESAAIRHLLDSNIGLDGAPRGRPATVLHLACHSNTAGQPNQHYVNVGGGEYGKVTIQQLTRGIMDKLGLNAATPRPLVFLNACASADPKMHHRSSFAKFFLEQHSLGVLGTLCDISDIVASHFARVFYQQLLQGRTVGEAMYDARWHLMDVHSNPLGLLYTFHGNPDLKLAEPHPGEVVPACTKRNDP